MLHRAVAPLGIPMLGSVPREECFHLPARHLGLVQASEHGDIDRFLDGAADRLSEVIDVAGLLALARLMSMKPAAGGNCGVPPLGQKIAIAQDAAFAFA